VDETLQVALFAMLEQLPLATITSLLALVIICIFFITSADSASLVLDTLTSGDDENSLARQRVFWAVSLGAIALVLLLAGGLDALSNVVTVTGLPFLIILALMSFSLLKALREEDTRPRAESGGPEERSEEPVSADGGGESRTREGEVTQSR
jgi:choline/glycine/proline betaine transport protein